jgi:hypothetical protein
VSWRWRRSGERELPKLGAVKVPPTFEDGVVVRMEGYNNVLLKTILQPWLAKGPKPIWVWGKDGMAWPDIVARRSTEMEARVALALECSGHPFATMCPRPLGVPCAKKEEGDKVCSLKVN